MARPIRIADLPSAVDIDPQSYVIIEKPGVGDGTFKGTVGQLQEAITVEAEVTQEDNITTIHIKDINKETTEQIVTPLADVTRDANDLISITITDARGETQASFVVPSAAVTRSEQTITINMRDCSGSITSQQIVVPTARIVDNGDGTSTITLTDENGVTEDTIVNDIHVDSEPTEGSSNLLTSGVIYDALSEKADKVQGGTADNIVTLDSEGNIADSGVSIEDVGIPYIAQTTAPSDTKTFWIDTANSNILKFYNGSEWIPIGSAWA